MVSRPFGESRSGTVKNLMRNTRGWAGSTTPASMRAKTHEAMFWPTLEKGVGIHSKPHNNPKSRVDQAMPHLVDRKRHCQEDDVQPQGITEDEEAPQG